MIRLLLAHHPLLPSPFSNLSLFLSLPSVSPIELTDGKVGRGWARSQIKPPRESLALYKSFNSLWVAYSANDALAKHNLNEGGSILVISYFYKHDMFISCSDTSTEGRHFSEEIFFYQFHEKDVQCSR